MEIITSSFFEIVVLIASSVIISLLSYIAVTFKRATNTIELHSKLLYGEPGMWDGLIAKVKRSDDVLDIHTNALAGIITWLNRNNLIDCDDDITETFNRLHNLKDKSSSTDRHV